MGCVYLTSASENLPELFRSECPFPQTTAAKHVENGKVVVNPPICGSRPRRTRIYRLKRSSRGIATVTRPHGNFACHGKIISPPSRTALYCTISAILKSPGTYISAFYPNTNAVGYTGTTTGAENNFVCVPFNAVGFNTSDIQQIKISDGGAGTIGWGTEFFSVWEGAPTVVEGSGFFFYDPSMDPNGEATDYYWGDDVGNKVTYSIPAGQGVVINCAADLAISINPPYSL